MLKRIKDWYDGEIKTYDEPKIIGIYTDRHWTSDIAHSIVEFYLAHWKWLWGLSVSLLGLYIAYLGLSKGA